MNIFTKLLSASAHMADQLIQILQQALQRNTKSTVLKSLGWLIALLLAATVFASRYGLDKWLVILFAVLDCIAIVVYIGFFIYFAFKNPDLLRSEKFTIQKMAIQHGLIGDDLTGFFKVPKGGEVPLVEGSKADENKKKAQ
jgi:hypothetical protein